MPYYAKNIITPLYPSERADGGVVANQPKFAAGCLDINASDKRRDL